MRIFFILVSLFSILSPLSSAARAQTPVGPPPPPSAFDSKAPMPLDLPNKLNIPPNIHIDVKGWRKHPLPAVPPNTNNPRLLWAPDLESATIESDQQNIHAVFQWEGGHSSEAFIIKGVCFRLLSLAYPDTIGATGPALNFWMNRTDPTEGENGNFPVIESYSPANFVGKAMFNGNSVMVFAPGGKKPEVTTFPDGSSICLDTKTLLPVWVDTGVNIYTFVYTPDSNVQINPQGAYLKAIQGNFGHWP